MKDLIDKYLGEAKESKGRWYAEIRIYDENGDDWVNDTVSVKSAITLDENGKTVEGTCKNNHRRRIIKLSPKMLSALKNQKIIYDQFKGKYFFCNETGTLFDPSNVRTKVWIPALKKAGLEYREMKQTRHSFGTYQLSKGTNPLKIAKVMGHRDAEMVIKVYGKYIDDGIAIED